MYYYNSGDYPVYMRADTICILPRSFVHESYVSGEILCEQLRPIEHKYLNEFISSIRAFGQVTVRIGEIKEATSCYRCPACYSDEIERDLNAEYMRCTRCNKKTSMKNIVSFKCSLMEAMKKLQSPEMVVAVDPAFGRDETVLSIGQRCGKNMEIAQWVMKNTTENGVHLDGVCIPADTTVPVNRPKKDKFFYPKNQNKDLFDFDDDEQVRKNLCGKTVTGRFSYNEIRTEKEKAMGEKTYEDLMGKHQCFGKEYDGDDDECKECSDEASCARCAKMFSSIKCMPANMKGNFYTKDQINEFGQRAAGLVKKGSTKDDRGGSLEHERSYHQVFTLLLEHMPDMLRKLGVVDAVEELISRVKTIKLTEADSDTLWDRQQKEKRDGTFMRRDEGVATGAIRRVKQMKTPCDSQDGEDVCADAGGAKEWMK